MSDAWVTVERLVSSARLGEREIICDGINANRCNTGSASTLRIWGVRPPTAAQLTAVTATPGTGGSMDAGDHLVAITFAVTLQGVILAESGPIQLAKVTVAATGNIALTSVPVSDNAAVNARVIYCSAAGGTVLYRVTTAATIANNTDTTYTISAADTSLTDIALPTANEFLPACPYAATNNNMIGLAGTIEWSTGTVAVTSASATITFTSATITRAAEGKLIQIGTDAVAYTIESVNETAQTAVLTAVYAGTTGTGKTYKLKSEPNTVYFSNALPGNIEGYDPLVVPSSVTIGDSDPITALGVCRGFWLVCKARQTYLMGLQAGASSTSAWDPTLVSGTVGCASHFTMVQDNHGNAIWYSGSGGVYRMQGGDFYRGTSFPAHVSAPLDNLLRDGVNHDRDSFAHAVWYEPRHWYVLWLTRTGETQVADLCIVGDFSDPENVIWWIWQLPAANSRVEMFDDGERLLISNYHGQVCVVDSGFVDGVASGVSIKGTIGVVDTGAHKLTCYDGYFEDATTKVDGAVVTVLTGVAAGQRRLVKDAANNVLEIDTAYYGGWFSPEPAVGDVIMLGGFSSYWFTPWLTLQSTRTKRWQSGIVQLEQLGADVSLDQMIWRNGAAMNNGRRLLPVRARDRATVMIGATGESWQGKLGTTGPAQPWLLRTMAVTADVTGGIR